MVEADDQSIRQSPPDPALAADAQAAEADEATRILCLDCGYELTGLNKHNCPECGRAFDPGDPLSVGYPPKSHEPELERGLLIVGVLLLTVNVWLYFWPETEPFKGLMWIWVALTVIFGLLLLTGVRIRRKLLIGITALYLFGIVANLVIGL